MHEYRKEERESDPGPGQPGTQPHLTLPGHIWTMGCPPGFCVRTWLDYLGYSGGNLPPSPQNLALPQAHILLSETLLWKTFIRQWRLQSSLLQDPTTGQSGPPPLRDFSGASRWFRLSQSCPSRDVQSHAKAPPRLPLPSLGWSWDWVRGRQRRERAKDKALGSPLKRSRQVEAGPGRLTRRSDQRGQWDPRKHPRTAWCRRERL